MIQHIIACVIIKHHKILRRGVITYHKKN